MVKMCQWNYKGGCLGLPFPPSTSSNKCNRKCNQTSVAGYNVTQQTSAPNKSRKAERPKEDL